MSAALDKQASILNSELKELEGKQKSVRRLVELKKEECEVYKALEKRIKDAIQYREREIKNVQKLSEKYQEEQAKGKDQNGNNEQLDRNNWSGYPLRQLGPFLWASGFWLVTCFNVVRAFLPAP